MESLKFYVAFLFCIKTELTGLYFFSCFFIQTNLGYIFTLINGKYGTFFDFSPISNEIDSIKVILTNFLSALLIYFMY